MNTIQLKPGRDKSVRQRHPWIFSGAVVRVEGNPAAGETVLVRSAGGEALGVAAYSPASQIRARMWAWQEMAIDRAFFQRQLEKAIHLRQALIDPAECNAYRLVHGESDGLPGIVVDRYGDWLVLQSLSAGAEYWKEVIVECLVDCTGVRNVYERSDVDVRKIEGLEERVGVLCGEAPPTSMQVCEYGLKFSVDLCAGQKTGFYLDQRYNRRVVQGLAQGRQVLNCFCYTGGFTVHALAGGAAEVLSVDSSAEALERGAENVALNGFPADQAAWLQGDVFQVLRSMRDQNRHFDLIILDPPKFAPTAAQAERAARGYKDINLLAFKMLRPGGLLATFSCSGGVSADLFQKIVAGAALDAHVEARIVERLAQGRDHPVALNFPEGAYLKGLVCQVA
ncbi:MAG: class I SAM-dependent rRNA methyltransferase [Anaerolineaceae bacterium]|nr:class I SAM-dependent rRNA methyltransferase [Anaerolineaceae bacterium]